MPILVAAGAQDRLMDAYHFLELAVGQPRDLFGQLRVLHEHLEVLLGHCALPPQSR